MRIPSNDNNPRKICIIRLIRMEIEEALARRDADQDKDWDAVTRQPERLNRKARRDAYIGRASARAFLRIANGNGQARLPHRHKNGDDNSSSE